jgi:DNA-binding LacI/PurR family transcriptional regulator
MRVVGVDDIAECRYTVPSLTSLGSVKKEIAQRAIRLLARRIDERDAPRQFHSWCQTRAKAVGARNHRDGEVGHL